MNRMLHGKAVSGGIAFGDVCRVNDGASEPAMPSVIIAHTLDPQTLAKWDPRLLLGIALENEVVKAVAEIAQELDIPVVCGIDGLMVSLFDGNQIIIDGYRGEIYVNPTERLINEYVKYQNEDIRSIDNIDFINSESVRTKDNVEIKLSATVHTPEDALKALVYGASGIGLLRTELIFEKLNQWPSEEEQLEIYKNIIKRIPDLPVTIRTLDIGGDKQVPYTVMPEEKNPALGLRGIRFSLDREEIFKTQLRAILRAGLYGKVKLLIPMVTDIREIKRTRDILENVKEDLKKSHIDFDGDIEVGIMIEVPSAALTIDILAEAADFFSIGTNDLIQYTLAVDPGNQDVSSLYEPLHPAILRLLDQVISDAQAADKNVTVCGEMAGDKDAILILLGLGARDFSMKPEQIPPIRYILKSIEMGALQQEMATLIERSSASEVKQGLANFKKDYFSNA